MNVSILTTLAAKELRDSLRNKWFLLYTIAFGVLSLGLAYLSLAGVGTAGFGGFGRTAAGLINLVLLVVPLMGLTVGATAIAGERERGTLVGLLTQPISRAEIFLGKYLGLAAAMLATLGIGFGLSALMMAWRGGSTSAGAYLTLIGLAYTLSLAMLAVGMLVSVVTSRSAAALGIAVFLWLTFALLGDLGLMGGTLLFKLQASDMFHLALINPLQVFKMASVQSVGASLDVLGPAGLYATRQFGNWLPLIFAGSLAGWIVGPLLASLVVFSRSSRR
jgi:Cu-processing system permease protein